MGINILKQIPSAKLPFVDADSGKINPAWFRFLNNLSIGGFLISGNNLNDVGNAAIALANLGGISLPGNVGITTLGTITIGTWHGSVLTGTYGGTGINNGSATITLANNLITAGNFGLTLTTTATTNSTFPAGTSTLVPTSTDISSSGIVTKTNNVAFAASATTDTTNASNISSGTLNGARLPNPSASTLGGIKSYAAVSNQWINTISTSGVPSSTQPAFSNLSGKIANTQCTVPTVQKFTSGSGTYTTPAGVVYIRVVAVGGGGGGGGSATSANNATSGGTGGNTTFGSTIVVANGGNGGAATASTPGAAGTASLSGAIGIALPGSGGCPAGVLSTAGVVFSSGGSGGASGLGGAGSGGFPNAGSSAGTAGGTNTGGGGGGAGIGGAVTDYAGSGGGSGGFCDAIITSPTSSYAYAVGAAGAAGAAGTSGAAGGAGGSGFICVFEYYQ